MSTAIILLGHGSRREEANLGLLQVARKVSAMLGREVTPAFMGHAEPSLTTAVLEKIREGMRTVIIMPLFLFRGIHVSIDIHEEIKGIRAEHPEVEIIFTSELGADDMIAQLASSRIKEAIGG